MASLGIFDSGYGGLTVFKAIRELMPEYDYLYLGDNARAPYGNLSFETVYEYTLECVTWLFEQGCDLVILACNTASAKALRNIQQKVLPERFPGKKLLGVIRPTAEIIGNFTEQKHIGILGTEGTVQSGSYLIEIDRFYPELKVVQHACPLWVPLIEANNYASDEALAIIKSDIEAILKEDEKIDLLLLACTHYPLIKDQIQQFLPEHVNIISQDVLVAESLKDYLERHPEVESKLKKTEDKQFFTTGDPSDFEAHTFMFFGKNIEAQQVKLVNK